MLKKDGTLKFGYAACFRICGLLGFVLHTDTEHQSAEQIPMRIAGVMNTIMIPILDSEFLRERLPESKYGSAVLSIRERYKKSGGVPLFCCLWSGLCGEVTSECALQMEEGVRRMSVTVGGLKRRKKNGG